MTLDVLPGRLAVCRLDEGAHVEASVLGGPFASVTRAPGEVSVVCAEADAPAGARVEGGWRALRVHGPLDFALTGVLAALAVPLAAAGLPIFVVSTFDTDVVLVREDRIAEAIGALRGAGHVVAPD